MDALFWWFGYHDNVDGSDALITRPVWLTRYFDHGGNLDEVYTFQNDVVNVNRLGKVFNLLPESITLNDQKFERDDLIGLTLTPVDGGHDIMAPIRVRGQRAEKSSEEEHFESFCTSLFTLKVKSM